VHVHLIVSNPPHAEDPDVAAAAPALALAVPDARLKTHYPIPEIWRAMPSAAEADAVREQMHAAGLRAVTVPGSALAAIPPRRPLVTFAFAEAALMLFDDDETTLPFATPVIAVAFSPRQGDDRNPPPAFLDLYAMLDGGRLGRWTASRGTTDFGGMGNRQTASFGANALALVERMEQQFTQVTVDRRLLNMQTRRPGSAPPPGVKRTGLSYATATLNDVLHRIGPGLADLEHDELASRLAFLTHAAG
jgi:hypothetical protein